ncbi:MAG TPA: transposase [Acetobacteraceae bacterium]|nr:transposase [Acetobacteraceae bacterium]
MDRVEVITRVERRRKWSEAEKAVVLAETDAPGASVAAIARKHGIAKSVLYTWRSVRRAQAVAAMPGAGPVQFIPVGLIGGHQDDGVPAQLMPPRAIKNADPPPPAAKPTRTDRDGVIDIELSNGVRLRVDGSVNERTLCRVLRSLKSLG